MTGENPPKKSAYEFMAEALSQSGHPEMAEELRMAGKEDGVAKAVAQMIKESGVPTSVVADTTDYKRQTIMLRDVCECLLKQLADVFDKLLGFDDVGERSRTATEQVLIRALEETKPKRQGVAKTKDVPPAQPYKASLWQPVMSGVDLSYRRIISGVPFIVRHDQTEDKWFATAGYNHKLYSRHDTAHEAMAACEEYADALDV